MWGEGGIERIQLESGGWPHLVQLIAETLVDLLNSQAAAQVTEGRLWIARYPTGRTCCRSCLEKECTLPGEWEYLRRFGEVDTQPPPVDDAVRREIEASHAGD